MDRRARAIPISACAASSRATSPDLRARRDSSAASSQLSPEGSDGGRSPRVLLLLLGGALAIRLIPLAFGIESTDILLYGQQAAPVVQGRNVYAVTHNVFPYTPVSMFYPALCLQLSWWTAIPFHVVIKLFAICSDAAIVLALYVIGGKLVPRRAAISAAALYAINPVSILVSSFHGNVMPLVVLLMLTAYLLFRVDPDGNLEAAGLLLGLAAGWRSFPILLLPFFLAAIDDTAKRIRFALCAVVPPALSLIPFAWVAAGPMLREILTYSGWGIHHGPFAVVRGLHLLSIGTITWENPAGWTPWMSAAKPAFLALYGMAVLFSRRLGLSRGILLTFILFELVYSCVASQYLMWPVPFLVLERRAMFWWYELAATYALVVFYWIFFPDILFGALDVARLHAVALLPQYVVSQALFSAVCAVVAVAVFARGLMAPAPAPLPPEPITMQPKRHTLGLLGQLVCLYYVLLFAWEIVFVLSLEPLA